VIQITNVSEFRFAMDVANFSNAGIPIAVNLPPKSKHPNWVQITNDQMHNWPTEAKVRLADGVAMGLVRVDVLNNIHNAHDRRPVPQMMATANDLASAISASTFFKGFFNFHVANTAWHTAPGVTLVTAADPVSWATVYVLVTDEQTQYTAHLAAAVHPNPDTVNVLVMPAPATPAQAIDALNELYARLGLHNYFSLGTAAPPLTPAAIIAY
jgi:hypothetical protein